MLKKLKLNVSVGVDFSDTGEATLRIIGVASEDDGVYTCVATNELGSVTSSASLRVLGENKLNTQSFHSAAAECGRELIACVCVCLSSVH